MIETRTSRDDLRTRIVDVAAKLLQEQGAAAVTTRGVADGAGVQAPTIYRLFGDKDGLLDAVAEHVLATYVAAKADIVRAAKDADVDPVEDLRAGWQLQIDFGMANPALSTLLSDPARGLQSAAVRSGIEVLRARVHRVALAGRLRVSEDRAVDLIHAAGTGAILTLLAAPAEHRDPSLADDLLEAVLGQILHTSKRRTVKGPAATAVTLKAMAPDLIMLSEAERRLLEDWLDRVIAAR